MKNWWMAFETFSAIRRGRRCALKLAALNEQRGKYITVLAMDRLTSENRNDVQTTLTALDTQIDDLSERMSAFKMMAELGILGFSRQFVDVFSQTPDLFPR